MKRRKFILAAAVTAVTIPVAKYLYDSSHTQDPLVMPDVLARFCDENAIREIGITYRNQVPQENKKEKLIEILLTDKAENKVKINDRLKITKLLDKKIKEEFAGYKTIVISGWVITTTEARQCALFSLT